MMINSSNIIRIKDTYLNREISGDFMPAVYVIEITNNCTLDCIMCPHSELKRDELGHMEIAMFEKIVLEISPYAENVMLYFMGEPLMHPQFNEILKIARKWIHGKISISTNGLFMDNAKCNSIVDNNIDFVICCLDHHDKHKYESIRRGSSYEKVIYNIENLIKIRDNNRFPHILIKALDINFEGNEIQEFHSFWNNKNVTTLVGWVDTWAGQLPNLKSYNSTEQPYLNIERIPCADLWFKMIINWKGDVVLCCHNYDYSINLGSLYKKNSSLKKIWQGAKIQGFRLDHLTKEYNSICKKCTEWAVIDELNVFASLDINKLNLVF